MSSNADAREARAVAEEAREKEWTLPSFGKSLFLGDMRLDLIYPQPKAPAADVARSEEFLATLRDFLLENVDPDVIERDGRIPDVVLDGLKKVGALGMKIPQRYGGLGLSQVYYNRALMLVGTWHCSLGVLLSAHQSIGAPQPLLYFGSEEQKEYWLPKLRTQLSAFALTEPGVGSDPAKMTCAAVPTEDGSGYRITGRKLWTTNGTIADIMVVLAKVPRSEGHKGGITAFIVPRDAGIITESRNEFMGMRGIENSLTFYDGVFVPKENVIGKEGAGLKIALTTLNTGRMGIPAQCAATAKWSAKVAREFASARVQWGKPIGQHDEVAQRVGFIAATAFGLEAVVDVTSRQADEKRNDVRIEAALAKLYTTELGWLVSDGLMQVYGGRGYETAASLKARGLRGVPVEQVLRDMRSNRIVEGSTEIMHLLIAREAVDQHLSVAGDLIQEGLPLKDKGKALTQAGRFYGQWYPKLTVGSGQNPSAYREFGPLAAHLRYAERASPSWRARPSTAWRGGGRRRRTTALSSGGSWTSERNCTPSARRSSTPVPWPPTGPSRRRPSKSWPTCSASRVRCAPSGCSTTCGTTPTAPRTPWRRTCSPAATPGWRRVCSTRPARVPWCRTQDSGNERSEPPAAGPRLMFSSRSSSSAHVLLHSVSGLRSCSSTASCSSNEDSWACSASMLLRCAARLPEIVVSCAAERAPGSGNVPGASERRAPNPARPSSPSVTARSWATSP